MPRQKNPIPSYLLHKKSGQARVRIAGREFLLGPFGSEASRIRYGELVAKCASGVPFDPLAAGSNRGTDSDDPGPSIAELIVAYLSHVEQHYVKNGQETSEQWLIRSAMKPLIALYGLTPPSQFGPLALKVVRTKLVESGIVRNSVNASIGRIRRMLRFGVANEIVPVDVFTRLEAVSPLLAG